MSPYIPVKKGTDLFPQGGQPVYGERQAGPDGGTAGGLEQTAASRASINAWLNAQRQAYGASTIPVHNATLSHPDFDAHYQNIGGSERVTISPRVQPGRPPEDQPTPPSPVSLPNDLVKLVNDVEDHTPKCLMVLYNQLNKQTQQLEGYVAAVDMDGLATATIKYQGLAAKSQWVPDTGRILYTMQSTLGKASFILWPLDITGTKAATKTWLSTTELGDAVETQGDPGGMPLLNGSSQQVFTTGGSFSFNKDQGLRLTGSLYTGGGNNGYGGGTAVEVPHAIAPDGTCYINAYMTSALLVAISPQTASGVNYSGTPGIQTQLNDKRKEVTKQLPKVSYHTPSVIMFQTATQDEKTFHGGGEVHFRTTGDGFHASFPNDGVATISGESFYGMARFGQQAKLTNYQHAEGSVDFQDYTGGDSGYGIQTAQGIGNLLDNAIPLMNYSADGLVVTMVGYTSNEIDHLIRSYDMGAKKIVTASAFTTFQGSERPVVTIETPDTPGTSHTKDFIVYGYGPGATPPHYSDPNNPYYTEGEARAYYSAIQSGLAGEGASLSAFSFIDLGGDQQSPSEGELGTGSTFGEYTSTSESDSGEADFPLDAQIVAVSGSKGDEESYFSISYSRQHWVFSYPTTTKQTITANLTLFGETQTFTQSGDEGPGYQPQRYAISVQAFPPLYQGKPWYVAFSGPPTSPKARLVTPYAKHDPVSTGLAQFTPWLHVSNGKHVLQGYYTDGAGYLHLDGGTKSYLPVLAKAIGCDPKDIVTMVMDITLKKIKAVAGVKPPDYSGSAAGDPGVIAHD